MTVGGWTRRDLLAALGATAAGSVATLACGQRHEARPALHPEPHYEAGKPIPWRNWSGAQACRPNARLAPASEAELIDGIARTRGPLRPAGAGHSFSPLVPTDGTVVSLDLLSGVVDTDDTLLEAEVYGGTRLFELGPALWKHGQAMPNLPDIDQQALAGAVATSTHGTGIRLGSVSASVVALSLVGGDGRHHRCSREENPELFHAARTSLGALGVVSRLRLKNHAAYHLHLREDLRETEATLEDAERLNRHRHFELFAIPHSRVSRVVTADETDETQPIVTPSDPGEIEDLEALHAAIGWIPGLGRPLYDAIIRGLSNPVERRGPVHSVLANTRVVRFNEMEYTVPAEAGPSCLREVLAAIAELPSSPSWPLELRYVQADDIWLSPFYERDGCTISLHQPITEDYGPFFDAIEPIFWKYEGRPHWGKLHSLDARRLAPLYPRWSDFLAVRRELDPEDRFLNPHLRRVFGLTA